MAVFKCKMCGGELNISDEKVAVCDYCLTKQTLPRLDDERKANFYDRANHFRRNNDYDKAMAIYEQILSEDNTDAESYWSLVLCTYGVEYVEDPISHKRIPTVNRVQFTPVVSDDNYKNAIKYATPEQKDIYEEEARVIDEIQKKILEISKKEEPFDVFICYKETDIQGRRTQDSVLATELYHELVRDGFKVFFSRITLEDKLGQEYEPYIFAALNSSKVMVVLGTKAEHFNAPWVKNEWSRYLSLIRKGERKLLIPAYKNMDPYDLPDEFSHLQAQDMSRLGFMQDLVHGIKKIVDAEKQTSPNTQSFAENTNNVNIDVIIKRISMFVEDGNWESADAYCEKVLDIDPENAQAYYYKIFVNYKAKNREELVGKVPELNKNTNYLKVLRFGDEEIKKELELLDKDIAARVRFLNLENAYNSAKALLNNGKSYEDYKKAQEDFTKIKDYKNSAEMAVACQEKIYLSAIQLMNENKIKKVREAKKIFAVIADYKDSQQKIQECDKFLLDEDKRYEEEIQKKAKKESAFNAVMVAAVIIGVVVLLGVGGIFNIFSGKGSKYDKAYELMLDGEYERAYDIFESLDGYKDSEDLMEVIEDKMEEENNFSY